MIRSRRTRCAEHVACVGEMRNIIIFIFEELVGKRSLERLKHRWEESTLTDLVHVDGLRRTAASNEPVVCPPDDMLVWIATVE
jgi:hypothetical protein